MSFLYYFSWLVACVYIKIRFKFKVQSQSDLKNLRGPLIITSNHKTYLDAYAILISFPLASKIHPIHTMAADWLYKNPLRGLYLRMVHTMPTLNGQGLDVSLKMPKEALSNNRVILIFPEGGINEENTILPESKIGPAALSLETQAQFLPIAVKFEGRICKVSIGKPYNLKDRDMENARREIMDKIKELYNA